MNQAFRGTERARDPDREVYFSDLCFSDHLRGLGNRLFRTLPNSYKAWGFSGLIFLPKLGARLFDLYFNSPWKSTIAGGPHFWEVGYSAACSRTAIVKRLKQRYANVRSGRFALKPYHMWFVCE